MEWGCTMLHMYKGVTLGVNYSSFFLFQNRLFCFASIIANSLAPYPSRGMFHVLMCCFLVFFAPSCFRSMIYRCKGVGLV